MSTSSTPAGKVVITCAVTGAIHTPTMSDHLPIWIELEVDYSDDYLRRFTG